MADYCKDALSDFARWATRNETKEEMFAMGRTVLGSPAAKVRFILSMTGQCPLSRRQNYKRIENGPVKGIWFSKDAKTRTEYDFARGKGPVIFYIHGGAFLSGNAKMWAIWMDTLIAIHKQRTGQDLSIFSLDYTLVPDAHFPKQWNECQEGFRYLNSQLGIETSRLFVSGDSAGANLAMQTVFELKEAKSLAGTILFSPWGYPAMSLIGKGLCKDPKDRYVKETNSWYTNYATDYITESFGGQGIQEYVGLSMTYQEAYDSAQINPFLRTDEEIRSLPEVLCIYGDGECLRDQIDEWCERVKKAGHPIQAMRHPDGVHDWALHPKYPAEEADFEATIEYVSKWMASRS